MGVTGQGERIPKGYKQTEVGVIPEEWGIEKLSNVSAFITKGATPTTYGFKWEEIGILFLRSECVGPNGLDLSQSMFISEDAHRALNRSRVTSGDILITITGNVGRVVIFFGAEEVNINQHIARIRIVKDYINSAFIFHFFSQPQIREHFISITTGQAYPQISLKQVREALIPLPPLPEQRAIAAALSDADALIDALTRLVAKKRRLKEGAMQELLTGRRRLPGFSGKWERKRLGEVAEIKTGSRNNQDKIEDGLYPFFVRSDQVERINSYSYDCEAILVPGEGRIGEIFHYITGRFDVHQRVYCIRDFSQDISGKFLHFYLKQFFGCYAMQNTVKATVDSLRLPTFVNFEMNIPSDNEEQSAIAAVLSDMDAELEALEAKLAKARLVKRGMMQALLTGRVRVV